MTKKQIYKEHNLDGYITAEGLIKEINYVHEEFGIPLNKIVFDHEAYDGYGSPSSRAYLQYGVLETDREYENRLRSEAAQKEQDIEWKRKQLERLKKELGEN